MLASFRAFPTLCQLRLSRLCTKLYVVRQRIEVCNEIFVPSRFTFDIARSR